MNIITTGRMYKIGKDVYIGTCQVHVHDQRGRLYVNYRGKQVNIKDIPVLPGNDEAAQDYVFDYVFRGGFINYPCPAMQFWIYRHRLGNKISVNNYKIKFEVKKK